MQPHRPWQTPRSHPFTSMQESCNTWADACDGGSDDACEIQQAGQAWLAFNVLSMFCLLVAAAVLLVQSFVPKLRDFRKFTPYMFIAAVVCLVVTLAAFYGKAEDLGIWNSGDLEAGYYQRFGGSGWLDALTLLVAVSAAAMCCLIK